jgi:hypothetical protein
VVVVAGRRLAERAGATCRRLVPARMGGLADRLSDRGGTLRDVRTEHPLFAPFREVPDALGAVRCWRYARLDALPEADVLARFDDGLPAVTRAARGQGRLLVLALPLDNSAGDFPLQPAFLPFVRQLVMHTSGRDATPLWRPTGESWSLPGTLSPIRWYARRTVRSSAPPPIRSALPYRWPMPASIARSGAGVGEPRGVLAVNVPRRSRS